MFLLGCGVTLLTLSVAVSLPSAAPAGQGLPRRANTLPYMAGADITTLADTLVAPVLILARPAPQRFDLALVCEGR